MAAVASNQNGTTTRYAPPTSDTVGPGRTWWRCLRPPIVGQLVTRKWGVELGEHAIGRPVGVSLGGRVCAGQRRMSEGWSGSVMSLVVMGSSPCGQSPPDVDTGAGLVALAAPLLAEVAGVNGCRRWALTDGHGASGARVDLDGRLCGRVG